MGSGVSKTLSRSGSETLSLVSTSVSGSDEELAASPDGSPDIRDLFPPIVWKLPVIAAIDATLALSYVAVLVGMFHFRLLSGSWMQYWIPSRRYDHFHALLWIVVSVWVIDSYFAFVVIRFARSPELQKLLVPSESTPRKIAAYQCIAKQLSSPWDVNRWSAFVLRPTVFINALAVFIWWPWTGSFRVSLFLSPLLFHAASSSICNNFRDGYVKLMNAHVDMIVLAMLPSIESTDAAQQKCQDNLWLHDPRVDWDVVAAMLLEADLHFYESMRFKLDNLVLGGGTMVFLTTSLSTAMAATAFAALAALTQNIGGVIVVVFLSFFYAYFALSNLQKLSDITTRIIDPSTHKCGKSVLATALMYKTEAWQHADILKLLEVKQPSITMGRFPIFGDVKMTNALLRGMAGKFATRIPVLVAFARAFHV